MRTHHLHVAVMGTPLWRENLQFRDLLRASPEVREAYLALKQELAEQYREDREAYSEAKLAFIQAALRTAA